MGTSPASPDITDVVSRIPYVVKGLKPPVTSVKSVKLRAIFYNFPFHQECPFLYEIGCTAFCAPQIHCFIQFVKFSLMNSLPVTFKTGIVFAKLLFIFYYRRSRCFSNIESFSNISTTDRKIAFLVIEQFYLFAYR